jgi:hypothetical protein
MSIVVAPLFASAKSYRLFTQTTVFQSVLKIPGYCLAESSSLVLRRVLFVFFFSCLHPNRSVVKVSLRGAPKAINWWESLLTIFD